jgi:hypothetical protein
MTVVVRTDNGKNLRFTHVTTSGFSFQIGNLLPPAVQDFEGKTRIAPWTVEWELLHSTDYRTVKNLRHRLAHRQCRTRL